MSFSFYVRSSAAQQINNDKQLSACFKTNKSLKDVFFMQNKIYRNTQVTMFPAVSRTGPVLTQVCWVSQNTPSNDFVFITYVNINDTIFKYQKSLLDCG